MTALVVSIWVCGGSARFPILASRRCAARVPSSRTGWLTVVVKVLVKCPTALPVQYDVGYQQHGKLSTVLLPGFQDLGTVPYANCPHQ